MRGRSGRQLPAGASGSTPVRLTVGDGDTVDVDPTSYDRETGSIRYYTADAEVTDAFAGLASGTSVPITVGNVFAPTGRGCTDGWSLVLVHTLDDAPCGTERREVSGG